VVISLSFVSHNFLFLLILYTVMKYRQKCFGILYDISHRSFLLAYETYFESHELVVWLGSPRIDLHCAPQGDDQELDLFIPN